MAGLGAFSNTIMHWDEGLDTVAALHRRQPLRDASFVLEKAQVMTTVGPYREYYDNEAIMINWLELEPSP